MLLFTALRGEYLSETTRGFVAHRWLQGWQWVDCCSGTGVPVQPNGKYVRLLLFGCYVRPISLILCNCSGPKCSWCDFLKDPKQLIERGRIDPWFWILNCQGIWFTVALQREQQISCSLVLPSRGLVLSPPAGLFRAVLLLSSDLWSSKGRWGRPPSIVTIWTIPWSRSCRRWVLSSWDFAIWIHRVTYFYGLTLQCLFAILIIWLSIF